MSIGEQAIHFLTNTPKPCRLKISGTYSEHSK